MILITVVDDNQGMLFHDRRQSQDRILRARILSLSAQSRLWMNAYSAKQFGEEEREAAWLRVDEAFLEKAAPGEYCFVENLPVAPYEARIEQILLFKWNRKYPADVRLDIDLAAGGWRVVSTEDFAGYSHEKITMEVYQR